VYMFYRVSSGSRSAIVGMAAAVPIQNVVGDTMPIKISVIFGTINKHTFNCRNTAEQAV